MMDRKENIQWPNGKKFAFTVVDDTDHATTARVKPIYDLLCDLGLLTTKTVWVYGHENDRYDDTETLEDPDYLEFIRDLQRKGFEIAFHGARGISSEREMVLKALEDFKEKLGAYPRMHVNHAQNEDNLYWTFTRLFKIQQWLHQSGLKKYGTRGTGYGASEGSSYFWGDAASEHIDYVRAGSFRDINTLAVNPEMPYYEKRFPHVKAWFSGSNGMQFDKFLNLISIENQNRLMEEGGLCIVNTHFGLDRFLSRDGQSVDREFASRLRHLSQLDGWFAPASEILDFLADRNGGIKTVNALKFWLKTRNK